MKHLVSSSSSQLRTLISNNSSKPHACTTSTRHTGARLDQPDESIKRSTTASYQTLKRYVDLFAASSLLLIASPLFAAVAITLKLSSGSPIFFRQERLTEGGRIFTLLKFRSMVINAEQSSGAIFARKQDPRVTRFGRFLRKTRLDELPQLLNIIRGDMSLIGPRPERPELAQELSHAIRRFPQRLQTKAGLTGLAQVVQGYPDGLLGYRRKLGFDLLYIKHQSIILDLWIALKTIGVIVSGSGAR